MMDEPQTRATLALMEVVGKLMIFLADTNTIPKQVLVEAALQAAARLEPTEEGLFLETLAEQWRSAARFVAKAGDP